jgi:hypothetical protein
MIILSWSVGISMTLWLQCGWIEKIASKPNFFGHFLDKDILHMKIRDEQDIFYLFFELLMYITVNTKNKTIDKEVEKTSGCSMIFISALSHCSKSYIIFELQYTMIESVENSFDWFIYYIWIIDSLLECYNTTNRPIYNHNLRSIDS